MKGPLAIAMSGFVGNFPSNVTFLFSGIRLELLEDPILTQFWFLGI